MKTNQLESDRPLDTWATRVNRLGLAGKAAIALGVLLVLTMLLLGGVYALGTVFFYDSYASSYEYDVTIYVDGETENAVFIVPVGVHGEEAYVDELQVTGSARFDGIEHAIVDTEHGPMLRIEIDEIEAGTDVFWMRGSLDSDRTIETRAPRNTEPVLSPMELIGPEYDERFQDDRFPDRRSFDATSTAYIEHDGSEDVEIGGSTRFRGGNDWWSFGWSWNEYETSVGWNRAAHGPDGVWVELTGWHTEGAGRYPTFPPAPS